ncbi:MAG: hypothetical protein KC416_17605, partial [Myxococcales bacterium]|nr:hypothetical protein [Myxococcales bacterium]
GEEALEEPRAFSIGYHPPSLKPEFQNRLHHALDHIDRYQAKHNAGPVVYARLSDLVRVWRP